MRPQDERAYGLHLPPKERIDFLLKDLTQEQLQKRPIAGFVWDIIKWLELAEEKAQRDALDAAAKEIEKIRKIIQESTSLQGAKFWLKDGENKIRALMPKEKSDDDS